MKEKVFLTYVTYKNKKYAVFSNKFHLKSFLEVDEKGMLQYPDAYIYAELDRIFNTCHFLMPMPFFKKSNFDAKVTSIMENGLKVLVAIDLSVIAMGLYSGLKEIPKVTDTKEPIEWTTETLSETLTENGTENFILGDGMVCIRSLGGENEICYSNDEFRVFLDNPHPTFEEVEETLDNNSKIPAKYQEFIRNYINHIHETSPDIDWAVFNYNLGRLEIVETSLKEIQEMTQKQSSAACFSIDTGTITLPEKNMEGESGQYMLIHELSHMFNCATIQQDGKEIVLQNTFLVATLKEQANQYYVTTVGTGMSEGLNDLFSYTVANSENISTDHMGYKQFADINDLWLNTVLKEDVATVQCKGPVYLYQQLKEQGLEAVEIIDLMDVANEGISQGAYLGDDFRSDIYNMTMETFAKNELAKGSSSLQIYDEAISALENGYIDNGALLMYGDPRESAIQTVSTVLEQEGKETVSDYKNALSLYYGHYDEKGQNIESIEQPYFYAVPTENGYVYSEGYAVTVDGNTFVYNAYTKEEVNQEGMVGEYVPILMEKGYTKTNEQGDASLDVDAAINYLSNHIDKYTK